MSKKVECPRCDGNGTIVEWQGVFGTKKVEKPCPNCGGTGYVYEPDKK